MSERVSGRGPRIGGLAVMGALLAGVSVFGQGAPPSATEIRRQVVPSQQVWEAGPASQGVAPRVPRCNKPAGATAELKSGKGTWGPYFNCEQTPEVSCGISFDGF